MQMLAVLAFVAFIGVSASAQSYQAPAQAAATISATLQSLTTPTPPSPNGSTLVASSQASSLRHNTGDAQIGMNTRFLQETLVFLKQGQDTGVAIESAYTLISSHTPAAWQSKVDQARLYTIDLLN